MDSTLLSKLNFAVASIIAIFAALWAMAPFFIEDTYLYLISVITGVLALPFGVGGFLYQKVKVYSSFNHFFGLVVFILISVFTVVQLVVLFSDFLAPSRGFGWLGVAQWELFYVLPLWIASIASIVIEVIKRKYTPRA